MFFLGIGLWSLAHSLSPSLPHLLAPSLPRSLIPPLRHPLTHSLAHSLTHCLTPSLPHSLTYSLPHSLIRRGGPWTKVEPQNISRQVGLARAWSLYRNFQQTVIVGTLSYFAPHEYVPRRPRLGLRGLLTAIGASGGKVYVPNLADPKQATPPRDFTSLAFHSN